MRTPASILLALTILAVPACRSRGTTAAVATTDIGATHAHLLNRSFLGDITQDPMTSNATLTIESVDPDDPARAVAAIQFFHPFGADLREALSVPEWMIYIHQTGIAVGGHITAAGNLVTFEASGDRTFRTSWIDDGASLRQHQPTAAPYFASEFQPWPTSVVIETSQQLGDTLYIYRVESK